MCTIICNALLAIITRLTTKTSNQVLKPQNLPAGFYIPYSHKERLLYTEIAQINPYLPDSAVFQAYEKTIGYPNSFFEGDIVINRMTNKQHQIQWYEAIHQQNYLRRLYYKPQYDCRNASVNLPQ